MRYCSACYLYDVASRAPGAIALHVSAKFRPVPMAATAAILALAGCAGSRGFAQTPPAAITTPSLQPAVPDALEWWRTAGDPILTTLVQKGLDASQEIGCRVAGLRQYDRQIARQERRIGTRLSRLLNANHKASAEARVQTHEDRVQRIATRRARLARQIAFSYVEVRRLQQEVAVRIGLRDQYKDNAEVARFRREAGLVSALDGALARSQDEAAQGELDFAQNRLTEAMAELARLVGDTPETLAAKLGDPRPAPAPSIDSLTPTASQDARHAALVEEVLREARLTQALEAARRTVRDARGAYRQGAGEFATLYVAEAAVTSVNLALINVRANRIRATLDLSSGADATWTRRGLEPMAGGDALDPDEPITVTADCD